MSASTVGETRKINVLVVGESPRLFSSFRRLERLGCECHFAESHREVSALLSHTKLDIVLSLYTQERLSQMMALLAGLRVSMFYMLPVEEGCWWLPFLLNGENFFGAPAIHTTEFTYYLITLFTSIT